MSLPALLSSLAIGLVASLAYFGALALLVRRLGDATPKRALLAITLSLPVRLGLLGVVMAWVVRTNGLAGALALLPSLLIGRIVIRRWLERSNKMQSWD